MYDNLFMKYLHLPISNVFFLTRPHFIVIVKILCFINRQQRNKYKVRLYRVTFFVYISIVQQAQVHKSIIVFRR